MQSTSGSDGSYTLTVTFAVGTDLSTSIALVQNAVSGALSQLPQDVQTQGVTVQKVSTSVLLIGSLYAEDDRFDEIFLSNYATINLRDPIARLPGVGQYRSSAPVPTACGLARPQQAEGLWPDGARRPERNPEPERAGRCGPARRPPFPRTRSFSSPSTRSAVLRGDAV